MNKKVIFAILFGLLFAIPSWAGKVDINNADVEALVEHLQGIGPVKARAIVDYREKNGPFKSIEDLQNVSGIGAATLEKNRAALSLEGGAATATEKAVDSVGGADTQPKVEKLEKTEKSSDKVKADVNEVVEQAGAGKS